MRAWKWVGLAGVAGVAATGVLITRAERRRAAYTAEQVRERLHARLAAAGSEPTAPAAVSAPRKSATVCRRARERWARRPARRRGTVGTR